MADRTRLNTILTNLTAKRETMLDAYLTKTEAYNTAVDTYTASPTTNNLKNMEARKRETEDAHAILNELDKHIVNMRVELEQFKSSSEGRNG